MDLKNFDISPLNKLKDNIISNALSTNSKNSLASKIKSKLKVQDPEIIKLCIECCHFNESIITSQFNCFIRIFMVVLPIILQYQIREKRLRKLDNGEKYTYLKQGI